MKKLKNEMLKLQKVENILFFLILLFLPTQLGKHFWPDFSYIYSLKIDYLSPTLYFWDILVIVLLLSWLLRKPRVNKLALSVFLFFLLTQALSLIKASNLEGGLVRLEQYFTAGLFGVYIASLKVTNLSKIFLPLGLSIIGESILASLQIFKGSTFGLWVLGERNFSITTPGIAKFDFYNFQFLRPYGTFPHPNVLAGFILLGICIMYQVSREKNKILSLTTIIGSIAIFLTISRVAILVSFITAIIFLKRKWKIVLVIVIALLSPVLITRYFSLFNFDSLTILRREELAENAWQIFLSSPFFGIGLNNFIPNLASNLLTGPSRFLQPVHNIILLALSETGIVGLVGFIGLIGYPIKKMYNLRCSIYSYCPWLIILFLGMFDHYFLTLPQGYRILFLIWGLSFSMVNKPRDYFSIWKC